MKKNSLFENLPRSFWATVRSISQIVGYTCRGENQVKIPTVEEIHRAFKMLNLNTEIIINNDSATDFVHKLRSYYEYRANVLNNYVEPRLMDAVKLYKNGKVLNQCKDRVEKAKIEFERLKTQLSPSCPIPMNKQSGEKKAPAYLTGMVNMIIEANAQGINCDYDPRMLTTITMNNAPLRTLARRVDGAFPTTVNPIAIWEIKEYYYTTTFGSRVADGIYESLLDGMELEELHEHENIKVLHYLIIDSHYTWWVCGKPYLCRIIDMLHMGYLDEVLFGYEVIERLPSLVQHWVSLANLKI